MLTLLHDSTIARLVQIALQEDVGNGDLTTELTIPPDAKARAVLLCKSDGVVCGLPVAEHVFRTLHDDMEFTARHAEGTVVSRGTVIADVIGNAQAVLSGERTALNFIQRMCGVATMAHAFASAIAHTHARILDTRKTVPGWRLLDKYAAQCGGAVNHRMGLFDMIMIKDNHIAAAGGIVKALDAVRSEYEEDKVRIEIECDTLKDVVEALSHGGFHRIMFDNFPVDHLRKGVELVAGTKETEASGGITLQTVKDIAETGVDFISTGAITHSAPALDISMDIMIGA
jgi:nicotinate-nucleotide pyrophosphorylase (carboxylating)